MKRSHAMPFGAQVREDSSVRFRLWAPQAQVVELSLDEGTGRHVHLDQLDQGWFELLTSAATSGRVTAFALMTTSASPIQARDFSLAMCAAPAK